jgi:hypothetical protein
MQQGTYKGFDKLGESLESYRYAIDRSAVRDRELGSLVAGAET